MEKPNIRDQSNGISLDKVVTKAQVGTEGNSLAELSGKRKNLKADAVNCSDHLQVHTIIKPLCCTLKN